MGTARADCAGAASSAGPVSARVFSDGLALQGTVGGAFHPVGEKGASEDPSDEKAACALPKGAAKQSCGRVLRAQYSRINGKRILLVDDVFTTGSTLKEAALALKRAGAGAVFALTAAKTRFTGRDGL